MAKTQNDMGHCYFCGKEISSGKMQNHLLKEHLNIEGGDEPCYVLEIVGLDEDKSCWLLVDIPCKSILKTLDNFLRRIWMECCGHMSCFHDEGRDEINIRRKMKDFPANDMDVLFYEYDFGTTTECVIFINGKTMRPKQSKPIRVLARNVPTRYKCAGCGAPATQICSECFCEVGDEARFCASCAETHEHDYAILSITNSPRCGHCAYDGTLDKFTFDPKKLHS